MFACQGEFRKPEHSQIQQLEAGLFPSLSLPKNTAPQGVSSGSTTGGVVPYLTAHAASTTTGNDADAVEQQSIFYNVVAADGSVVQQEALPGSAFIDFDETLHAIMQRYDVPGISVSITRNGEPVFVRSYGYADRENEELVSDQSLFRIASLSKPITSAGILKLIQDGKLTLADKVFGPEGILADEFPALRLTRTSG
ncbi:serine hydrolase [Pontibacter sp. BAB1700]|uniref:serine hydrolase domain-containing protein n=1 Tax=Pontibacter sp. BAB1700 TaxID=1144253 RepID=UPI0002D27EED|nr:serine hydrolase domain-containing protein [Pontibacter sp. BAB1700]